MRCIVITLIAVHAIICNASVHHTAYHPVFEYDVPVASQPIVYAPSTVHPGQYYGTYAVHTSPAVSHTYSQTQTHPVSYVKHATDFQSASGHYYTPPAATSRVEQSRLIVPQTNRIYRYQTQTANQQYGYPEPVGNQYVEQVSGKNFQGLRRQNQQFNSQAQNQYNGHFQNKNDRDVYANKQNGYPESAENQYGQKASNNNFQGERRPNQQFISDPRAAQNQQNNNYRNKNNFNAYADGNPTNGEGTKLRRYQVHRPGIKEDFFDVEERVIVRPAGSALIEFNRPTKKQDITQYRPNNNGYASKNYQSDSRGFKPYDQYGYNDRNQNEHFFSTAVPDCYGSQTPVHEYSPPATSFDYPGTQYHPTSFAPTTTAVYPTTVTVPSQTYQPPIPSDESYSSTSTFSPTGYTPSTTYSSTPGQYTPTTTSATAANTTPKQSDIFISSTTPVSVTIVDKNGDTNQNQNRTSFQGQDIVYANKAEPNENSPDQFQNELPPRGDLSQYRAEQPDQFYHELPRGRYSNDPTHPPQTFNVYSKPNGEPTEQPYNKINGADVVDIEPSRNYTNNQNQTSYGQQGRLIELYINNDGVSEAGQTNSQYRNSPYPDVGNVRARVVSVTPPPATAVPTETVNRRRIVVSNPVTTVEEVVEANNSTGTSQAGNNRADNANRNQGDRNCNEGDSQNQNNFESNNNDGNNNGDDRYKQNYQNEYHYNPNSDSKFTKTYQNGENNANFNENFNNNDYKQYGGSSQGKKGNYESTKPSTSSNGVFISATPTTASQRIIYVQPVSQDFSQQKAVPPKNY